MVKTPPAPSERIAIQAVSTPKSVVKVSRPIADKAFYHSGDAGDILYALLFIKSLGGGKLYIGPDSRWGTNSNHDRQRYHWILPLLKVQPYLRAAEYVDRMPPGIDYDLNLFREIWMTSASERQAIGLTRLFEAYPKRFGVPGKLSEEDPWLSVEPRQIRDRPVVIHRSPRYRNHAFPWAKVAARYAHQIAFVGLRSEYNEWVASYGQVAEYQPTDSALEIAKIVAGAKLFVGNQSCPNAMALGLGVPLIQEVCVTTPDCVFRRSNTQYYFGGPINLPAVGKRFVTPVPNEAGIIELGPCADATGLGDYLTITPVMRELGDRCVMKIPESSAGIGKLFEGLCKVEVTDDYPVFRHIGGVHAAQAKLDLFGLKASTLPKVIVQESDLEWARGVMTAYGKSICFVPTCSAHWAHLRQKVPQFWAAFLPRTCGRTILQFGREDYPLIEGAIRMPFYNLTQLAALYAISGSYLGVDTGDSHLMLAVGGRAVIVHPSDANGYSTREWHYPSDRASYVNFNSPEKIYGYFNGR